MVSINSACREHVGPSGGKKTGAVVAKIDTGESSVSRAIPIQIVGIEGWIENEKNSTE